MRSSSLPRLGLLTLFAMLCLGHGEVEGGCGGGGGGGHGGHTGPTGATCPDSGAPTAQDFGRAFMESYCLPCHSASVTGTARQGAPQDVNFDTLEDVRAFKEVIDSHAAAGPNGTHTLMPPSSRVQPSQDDRIKLGQWLACGAP
jgi:cytochrome c5